ncbi:MAG: protein phosphatase 2C domain-containing protein, partial [Ignavibacteriaceae bacterium]
MPDKEKLTFSYYGSSDIGLVRVENQDSMGKFPPNDFNLYTEKGQLFIVADGMGGHAGGKEASRLAVDTIRDVYFSGSSDLSASLKEAVEKANYNIFKKSEDLKQFRGMGTTCTVLVLKEDKGLIAHVGDSRIYLIENNTSGKIVQLTEDHTKVHEMVKEGILTEKEAEAYPSKSVLSRALGVDQKVNADYKNIAIKNGQSYVM